MSAVRSESTVVQMPSATAASADRGHSAFWPLLLGGLALILMLGWQASLLTAERSSLQGAYAGQQQMVDNAGALRTKLDALAADTQRLADVGNPNAALLVTELRKRGITINQQAAAEAASASGR